MMKLEKKIVCTLLCAALTLTGCAPVSRSDPPTTNYITPVLTGAGTAAALRLAGASKYTIIGGGLLGAAVGYYFSSLRSDSAGIVHVGGQVFTLGEYVTIDIPTDNLFETNTAEFLPGSEAVLNSIVSVLNRYPNNNVMISGNTSGFGSPKFEQQLSEARAKQIAGYLWAHHVVDNTRDQDFGSPKYGSREREKTQMYVGYGNYFPIANNFHLKSIRQNSRIQITSFPTQGELHVDGCYSVYNNLGEIAHKKYCYKEKDVSAFTSENMGEDVTSISPGRISEQTDAPVAGTENKDFQGQIDEEDSETPITNYNSSSTFSQTEPATSEEKHGGYKGEG